MSGKKASEVNALLRNGENTRSASMDILNDAFKKAQSACNRLKKAYNEAEKEIPSAKLVISDEVKNEFPEAVEKLEKEYNDFVSEFHNGRENYIVDVNENSYTSLLSRYKDTDKRAEDIRKCISDKIHTSRHSDPWYCDDEYRSAGNIAQEYRNLSSAVNSVRSEFTSVCSKAKNNESVIESKKSEFKKIASSVADITKKSKEAIEVRKHAKDTRDTIRKEFTEIDKATAGKFLSEDYKILAEKTLTFLNKSDSEVISGYSAMSTEISIFSSELNKVYSAFLERQGQIKSMIDNVCERLDNRIFSNPEDEFKREDKRGSKMTLQEFLEKNSDTDYPQLISDRLSQINAMYDNEQFDLAESYISDLSNLIEEASNKAVLVHQNMKKTIYNMLSIKKVMLKMNYDVKVVKNGDFLNDGYCIECTAGDEIIKYDRVSVVDDGQPVIDIDHKESSKGTCGSKWKDIRSELSGEGLIIEDITKNGRSIFGTPPANAKSENTASRSVY
ncbi:MAG: hypothetical protein NC177_05600 [Ruminococcus flavefaciens]|nr:hypothetical protein [Ruminococcus flavefaciens]